MGVRKQVRVYAGDLGLCYLCYLRRSLAQCMVGECKCECLSSTVVVIGGRGACLVQ